MAVYDLYLESGPKRKKTMVHVLGLLGCVAVGPTTEEAIAATPAAIAAFRRFLDRHGEKVDVGEPVETQLVEHITQGDWLGNGSPYLLFGPDRLNVPDADVERYLARVEALDEELAAWADRQSDAQLDAAPETGRPARAILLHVLGAQGAYLAASLGSAPGFSRLHGQAERGELPLAEALRRCGEMAVERVRATTPEERTLVRELPAGDRTFHQGLRRMLEHAWEHLAELSRRPGGPAL